MQVTLTPTLTPTLTLTLALTLALAQARHTEHLRREAVLQASRDEIAASAQEAQRDATLALARVRDEEAPPT